MLETERLLLRRWNASDRAPFAKINADRRVMEFLGAPLNREQSDAIIDRAEEHFRKHGFGPYAVELKGNGECLGFIGLMIPSFGAHFTPCVEIGWRLATDAWGRGYATEGASALMNHAFREIGLPELVSFTAAQNVRSRRVMEKLGMTHNPAEDFDHPRLREGDPLRRHVLYRMKRDEYVGGIGMCHL